MDYPTTINLMFNPFVGVDWTYYRKENCTIADDYNHKNMQEMKASWVHRNPEGTIDVIYSLTSTIPFAVSVAHLILDNS